MQILLSQWQNLIKQNGCDKPDLLPAWCPNHYSPKAPVLLHSSNLLDNLNHQTKSLGYRYNIKMRMIIIVNKKRYDCIYELWMHTYSWSIIFSGARQFEPLQSLENCVFLRISVTSAFLLSSFPSFSPEAR